MKLRDASIGIVGTGPIGRGLAELWGRSGARVTLGARSVASARALSPLAGVSVGGFEDAAAQDVVILAVAHSGVLETASRWAPALAGKVVIDTTNAVELRHGRAVSGLPEGVTEGQWMSRTLPRSRVVRAFTHIQDELLVSRPTKTPGIWAVGYATDDESLRPELEAVLAATGYAPVHVGALSESAVLDAGGAFFPRMLTRSEAEEIAAGTRLPRMLEKFNDATIGDVLHDDVIWSFPYGPTIGVQETFAGRAAVVAHLSRVQASGVRIRGIRTELVGTNGAVVHAIGTFPLPRGVAHSPIVSIVRTAEGLIVSVQEYWDTAALR